MIRVCCKSIVYDICQPMSHGSRSEQNEKRLPTVYLSSSSRSNTLDKEINVLTDSFELKGNQFPDESRDVLNTDFVPVESKD